MNFILLIFFSTMLLSEQKYKEPSFLLLDTNNNENDDRYIQQSPFMINRYDCPWRLPFLRRNEVLVKIK